MAVVKVMACKDCNDVGIMARVHIGSSQLPLINNSNNSKENKFNNEKNNEDGATASIVEYGGATGEASSSSSEREADSNMRIIYVPQTVYLKGAYRHAYEASSASAGPADSGVVSKWRMKDRVSSICLFYLLFWKVFWKMKNEERIELFYLLFGRNI
jgi:hypothetical protein